MGSTISGTSRRSPAVRTISGETKVPIPGEVTLTLKSPGGSRSKVNCPLLPETIERVIDPALLVSVTVAPGTSAPVVSRTVPVMLQEACCAGEDEASASEETLSADFAGWLFAPEFIICCASAPENSVPAKASATGAASRRRLRRFSPPRRHFSARVGAPARERSRALGIGWSTRSGQSGSAFAMHTRSYVILLRRMLRCSIIAFANEGKLKIGKQVVQHPGLAEFRHQQFGPAASRWS